MTVRRPEAVRVLLASDPASVATARAEAVRCARVAGMAPEAVDRIRLAVSEAVTNAVLHAYPGAAGDVELLLDPAPGRLRVQVRDAGCGRHAADPATASAGFGLGLMRVLSDGLQVDDSPPGTRVVLRFEGREGDVPRGQ
ncbi:MAG: ATP-binding protein [Thermoleophilia bacterium]